MNTTDPIADMLTRIRNANTSKHKTVDIPASKMKTGIAEILFKEGYIKAFEEIKNKDEWGIAVIGSNKKIGSNAVVKAKTMVDEDIPEVK